MADDNEALRVALAAQLASWGMAVEEASDLPGACAAVRAMPEPVELAIVDYDLGGGHTGLDLLGRLDAQEGRHVPGIVITGSEDPDVHRLLNRSGYLWFQKPFEPDHFRDALLKMRPQAVA